MVHKPFISVVVTAYDRRQYLLGAVRSALNQTLPRDFYEVIVVKNFRDDSIDSKLNEWGVTNLYSKERRAGAQVHEALQVASGDVISFLDDDDEFMPGKLEAVYGAFQKGVDYYHNGRVEVNEQGSVLGKEGASMFVKGKEEKARYAIKMTIMRSMFHNNSSISIRRSMIGEEIKNVELATDAFCFVEALLSAEVMADDPRRLTVYRVHSQNVTRVDPTSFEASQERRLKNSLRYLIDATYVSSLARGSLYEHAVNYFFLSQKLIRLSMPQRPPLGDPDLDRIKLGDIIVWISYLPYFRYHMRYFTMRLLPPLLPGFARRAIIRFTFKLSVRRAFG